MIDDHKVIIPKKIKGSFEVRGVVATARAKKLILLSATFAPYHIQFMKQVLNIKANKMYALKGTA
jgi:hypothetical protein